MNENVSEEELNIIRQAVRTLIKKDVDPLGEQMEEEDEVPSSLINKAAEMGLFGLSIPQEYDGLGAGMVGKVTIFEELGRGPNCFVSIIGCHNGIGSVGIVLAGNEEQIGRAHV